MTQPKKCRKLRLAPRAVRTGHRYGGVARAPVKQFEDARSYTRTAAFESALLVYRKKFLRRPVISIGFVGSFLLKQSPLH